MDQGICTDTQLGHCPATSARRVCFALRGLPTRVANECRDEIKTTRARETARVLVGGTKAEREEGGEREKSTA